MLSNYDFFIASIRALRVQYTFKSVIAFIPQQKPCDNIVHIS